MQKQHVLALAVAAIAIIGFFLYSQASAGQRDEFAKCMSGKGVKLYGTFWCSHCKEQKEMFGSSVQYLNYVECSTPDGNSQTQACKDAGISSYPTWEFQNGIKLSGVFTLEELAGYAGCKL